MQVKSLISAALFAAIAGLSLGAYAAPDADKATEAKAADASPQKPVSKKKVKPHSHMEDKTGVTQKAPEAMADKPNAAEDKSKHYHPRDGK